MKNSTARDTSTDQHPPLSRPQRGVVLALVDAGFTWADAKTWARGWECDDEDVVVHQATWFANHGDFTVEEATGWLRESFWMPEAATWMEAGYTPAQASRVYCLADTLQDAMNWIATGLPAHRVITYLQAGVTVDEVPGFENSPDVSPETLPFMSALLHL